MNNKAKTKSEILNGIEQAVLSSKFVARNTLRVKYADGSEMARNIQILPARKYYGRHAAGHVVLCDNYPVFHGPMIEARAFCKALKVRML